MNARKAMTRFALAALAVASVFAGWAAYHWTSPAVLRQLVTDALRERLAGYDVHVGTASLRLLGGISVTELRVGRPGGPDLLTVPNAVIYHDKEQLAAGRLAVRKVELRRPRVRLVRGEDGRWNAADLLRPGSAEPPPSFLIEQGTVVVEDRSGGTYRPPLELFEARLALLNDDDPAGTLKFEGEARCPLVGPLRADGSVRGDALRVSLAMPQVPVGPELTRSCAAHWPDLAEHVRDLRATAAVELDLARDPDESPGWRHDVRVSLRGGELKHPALPLALTAVEAAARLTDGRLTLERASARSGAAEFTARAAFKKLCECRGTVAEAEGWVESAELGVKHLELSPALFDRLPPKLKKFSEEFHPAGPVSLTYSLAREPAGTRQRCVVRPEGLRAVYDKYRYPLAGVRGTLDQRLTAGGADELTIDLVALTKGDRPVTIRGTVLGEGPGARVSLDIAGDDLCYDDTAVAALPGKFANLARTFSPSGRGGLRAEIRSVPGEAEPAKRFELLITEGTVNYDLFPYRLDDVSGRLVIHSRPQALGGDSWEFTDFRGTHGGATVRLSGRSDRTPQGETQSIKIAGRRVPLDADLLKGLGRLNLGRTWEVLDPSGEMDFEAFVLHHDRPGGAAAGGKPIAGDLALSLAVRGPTIRPEFFRYEVRGVTGSLRFAAGRVTLGEFHADHGPTKISLKGGDIHLPPGGVYSDLRGLRVAPLVADGELLDALPEPVREGARILALGGDVALDLNRLTVSVAGDEHAPPRGVRPGSRGRVPDAPPPDLYWDARLTFAGGSVTTGVPWRDVVGVFTSRGNHKGGRLGPVKGNVQLDRATVFRQPVGRVGLSYQVSEAEPKALRLENLSASVFGGDVVGSGRVVMDSPLRYDLSLLAMGLRLEELARYNRLPPDVQLQGAATLDLFLTSQGAQGAGAAGEPAAPSLTGSGRLDIPACKIAKLPAMLEVLKLLKLRAMDSTAFDEARASFHFRDGRLEVTKLDLFGNAVSLSGTGSVGLDGRDLRGELYAVVVGARLLQMLPEPVRDWPAELSKHLFKIKVSGSAASPRYEGEAVPDLVEPVRAMLGKMRGQPAAGREGGP